jgi:N-acetylglucosaminyldiphosphoundecaprenol N-acetyl-beta-D-mannosaminyltransferase
METNTAVHVRQDLFGLPFDPLTMTQAMDRCRAAIHDGDYLSVGVVNAAKVMTMRRDLELKEAVSGCDMVLADGQSVVWASRMLRAPLPERVAGIDLFLELLAEAAQKSYRVYFLGARRDVLNRMLDELARRFPGLQIAGARDGYFRPEDEFAVAAEIRDSRADLLFVGMSTPKKELFLNRWGKATRARVVHGVGGSFDVLAGLTNRAPLWWQRRGLEWLYRALQEPLRLGPRYLKTNLSFIALVAREAVRRRPARRLPPVTAACTDVPVAQVEELAPAVSCAQGDS